MTEFREGDRVRVRSYPSNYSATVVQDLAEVGEPGKLLGVRVRVIDGERQERFVVFDAARATRRPEAAKGPKVGAREAAALYKRAHEAGLAALEAATPTPMLVGTPKDLMGSLTPGGDDGGFDPNEPVYFVAGGVCGFAWVTVRPGNSSFARWLVKNGKGSKGYYGGIEIWVREGGQSMERKEAYARAFADTLREAGIEAFPGSRMD